MSFRMSSPVMNERSFEEEFVNTEDVMTVNGTITRTAFLLFVLVIAAYYPWSKFFATFNYADIEATAAQATSSVMPFVLVGGILGFILCIIMCFKMNLATYLAVPYAACEGFLLGGLSALLEAQLPNIVLQATALTMAVLFGMLLLYRLRIIQATAKLRAVVMTSMFAILAVYLLTFILGFFDVSIPYIYQGGVIGVGFSLFVCAIASLMLIFNFDLIEKGSAARAPKYMSWYASFGLLVTLVWLYLEMLRLLSKLRD